MKTIEKTVLALCEDVDNLTAEIKELEAQNLVLRRNYNALEIQKSEDITKLAFDIISIAYTLEKPLTENVSIDNEAKTELLNIFRNVRKFSEKTSTENVEK
jgi:hypothetical protein